MASSSSQRVQKHRAALRAQGLKPVQIWVPDVNAPGFAEEYRRQAKLLAEYDDPDIDSFMDAVNADLDLPPYEEG